MSPPRRERAVAGVYAVAAVAADGDDGETQVLTDLDEAQPAPEPHRAGAPRGRPAG